MRTHDAVRRMLTLGHQQMRDLVSDHASKHCPGFDLAVDGDTANPAPENKGDTSGRWLNI